MDSPVTSGPSAGHTRTIRSFAHREDADRAKAVLSDHNIESSVREYRVPDNVTGKLVTRSCSLCIDPADAGRAARLLMKMAPSEAPGTSGIPSDGPTRLRRRSGKPERQRTSVFMIGFAVASAAGMILFAANTLFGPKKPKKGPISTENIVIEEDLNGDTLPDVVREFTWNWIPVRHTEDRNFDTMWDMCWIWQNGKPAYRDVDLNFDGKYDERTTYDPTGRPFYTDSRPGSAGPVRVRKILRDGILWKVLEDRDADSYFDHLTEYDETAAVVREEELPPDSPENNPPSWPPPPAPDREDNDPGMDDGGAPPPKSK